MLLVLFCILLLEEIKGYNNKFLSLDYFKNELNPAEKNNSPDAKSIVILNIMIILGGFHA